MPPRVVASTSILSASDRSNAPTANQAIPRPPRTACGAPKVGGAREALRADIARRCLELEPPLQPQALKHMECFRDILLITNTLTDEFWENLLKPKILKEREAAEMQEYNESHKRAIMEVQQSTMLTKSDMRLAERSAKKASDRHYEAVQLPLRSKLGEYASDRINGYWHQGRSLDMNGCALFAVDVLLYVRRRFDDDKDAGILSSILEPGPKAGGASSPPQKPFLSLELMKWVFEKKIRIYTDPITCSLFACAGCDEHWFTFDGLVQHYAAKHTDDFSVDNSTVRWQTTEWPDEPPFHDHPEEFFTTSGWTPAPIGRPQGKPHPRKNKGHISPAHVPLLSENPAFSGTQSISYSSAEIDTFASHAREVWDKLDGVNELQGILECVRVQTVINHATTRFIERFKKLPDLDLLTVVLHSRKFVSPLKATSWLLCKQCALEQVAVSGDQAPYGVRVYENPRSLIDLVVHYKLFHESRGRLEGQLDWEKEIVEIAEPEAVRGLIHKPGMTDQKLALIAEALPLVFKQPPLPPVQETRPEPRADDTLATRMVRKHAEGPRQSKKKNKKGQAFSHATDGSPELEPEPTADEYDPQHSVFMKKEPEEFDPARYDTDLSRKNEAHRKDEASPEGPNADEYDPQHPVFVRQEPEEFDLARHDTDFSRNKETPRKDEAPREAPHVDINLSPELLAALDKLGAYQIGKAAASNVRERRPSVGRPESRTENGQRIATQQALPQANPDIASIKAGIQGQIQGSAASSTPFSAINRALTHTPYQAYDPHPYQPYDPRPQQSYARAQSSRPSSRQMFGDNYRGPVEASTARNDGQDLQAALMRNAHHFTRNSHFEPAPAPAPVYAPRSPPRFRVAYEDEPAPYHYHHQPYDAKPAPVQYVPISNTPAMPSYRYDHRQQPPRKVYVDEYGRELELIPVNAAPAPVQYMPHPYEQQYARHGEYATPALQPPQAMHHTHRPAPQPQLQAGYVHEDRASVPRG